MHALTIFPRLLDFVLVAPLILRLTVSIFILILCLDRYKKPMNWTMVFYAAAGILLILGLYTQATAILGVIVLKFDFYTNYWVKRNETKVTKEMYMLYAMAGIVLLSLLVTGPGLFAFDLPF